MCGVAGVFNFDGAPADAADLRAVAGMLAHRGPDGEGVLTDGPLGLAHRRLAILDPSAAAAQPMTSPCGRFVVVFNGEIYNFLELRAELAAMGRTFRGDGDTEVILAAWEAWGEDCQSRFNGMWAFALWDRSRRRLFLSRDRFGVKPLHWLCDGRRLAFSSELKGFLGFSWFRAEFDPAMLALALTNPAVVDAVEPRLLKGVNQLRAGHCLSVGPDGEPKTRRWWRALDHLPEIPAAPAAQRERLRDLLFDACALRMRSDAPLASAVSGGLDSAVVHGAMARLARTGAGVRAARDPWRAYVAAFPGTPQDETPFARAVIDQAGSRGVIVDIDPQALADSIDDIIFAHEAVFDHPTATWALYRAMAQDGIKVSLDGHGGDELFCGYRHQLHDVEFRTFDPARRRMFRDVKNAMTVPGTQLSPPTLNPATFLRWRPADPVFPERAGDEAALERFDPLSRRLYMDFHYATLPNILANFDRMSMAHGVEIRAPLLDWRLVCFALALPWECKVAGGYAKAVLRDAFADLLPESVRTRRGKLGFVSPLRDWTLGPLRRTILDATAGDAFRHCPVWDGPGLAAAAQTADARDDAASLAALWPYVQASRLMETFASRRPGQS